MCSHKGSVRGVEMLEAVVLPEPLFISLSLGAIVLHRAGVSTSAALQSAHDNQLVPRPEVNLKLTPSLTRGLLDREINRLPPPLMVMRSCSSGRLEGTKASRVLCATTAT